MKAAVVYYSRTQTTEKVASLLARKVGADILPIKSDFYRPGMMGYMQAILHALRSDAEPTSASPWDFSKYDLVLIGTPVWGSHVSAPVRSFLLRHAEKLPRVAFFCTCGGSGAKAVFARMAQITKKEPLATLTVTAKDFARHDEEKKVADFLEELHRGPSRVMFGEPVLHT